MPVPSADDAIALVDLYRRFRGVGFMTTTATLWDEADAQARELAAIGESLQSSAPAAKGAEVSLQPTLARIRALERTVAAVNDATAAMMSEGLRQTSALLMLINVAVGVALLMIAVIVTQRLIRNREDAENDLRISEERFEYAVLASNDGIWDWSLRSEHLFPVRPLRDAAGVRTRRMHETPASFLRRIHPRERHRGAGVAHAPALRQSVRSRVPHSDAGRLVSVVPDSRPLRARCRREAAAHGRLADRHHGPQARGSADLRREGARAGDARLDRRRRHHRRHVRAYRIPESGGGAV
jgi:PAS domain-containing protein